MPNLTPDRLIRRIRWALSNHVIAGSITVTALGGDHFHRGDWLTIGGELRRVHGHACDRDALLIY